MQVTVQLIPNRNWPYITKYKGCFECISPYIKADGGGRYTGFDDTNADVRKELEKKLNTDLSENSEYWDNFQIKIYEDGLNLDPDKSLHDRLKLIFLERHVECADPSDEKSMTNPSKKFYIENEEKIASAENARHRIKRECYRAMDNMDEEDVRNALRMYGINPEGASNQVCVNKLNAFVDEDPIKFKNIWIDNEQKDSYILFTKAVAKNIIKRSNGQFMYGGEFLGTSIDDVISFLNKESKLEIRQGIAMAVGNLAPAKRGSKRTEKVD